MQRLGMLFVEGSKDELCLRKNDADVNGEGVWTKISLSPNHRNQNPIWQKEIMPGDVRNQQIRRNRENGQLRGRFDVVGNKDPLRVSEHGSDMMKTMAEEDETQAGRI